MGAKQVNKGQGGECPAPGPSSLIIFTDTSLIRRLSRFIQLSPIFEYLIFTTIFANCVVMAMEEQLPNEDQSPLNLNLIKLEPVFLAVFTVESVVKIVSLGLFWHPGSYLRNVWNILDFIVVTTAYIEILFPDGLGGLNLRTLRAIRVLRPLKLVSGVQSLQVVLKAIIKAMAPLLQIGLLVLFAIVIFAIIGLEFYSGAFHKTCYSLDDLDAIAKDGDKPTPCGFDVKKPMSEQSGRNCSEDAICLPKWIGPNDGITSFDNIAFAMLTVFQCITMEGWTSMLYWTNDAVGSMFNWMYFVPLIVIGSFFMLNLVLGVLSGEFAKERDRVENREAFMKLRRQQQMERELHGYIDWICKAEEVLLAENQTSEKVKSKISQRRAKAERKKLKEVGESKSTDTDEDGAETDASISGLGRYGEKRDDGTCCRRILRIEKRFRFCVRRIVRQQWFYWFVITLVFLNTAFVASMHYGQEKWLEDFNGHAEYVFLGLFLFEMLLRVYALGPNVYFKSAFNRFDSIVISGSIFEVVWASFRPDSSFGISVLRALRLLRIFKVTKYWSSLRNLVIALLNSMRSIISLLFLLFLFILIFALLGMRLFGGEFNNPEGTPDSNFDSFTVALLTVFIILTGEDWNEVMYQGVNSKGGIDGDGMVYSLYFIILVVFGNYTLLNVFLAIAVDSLADAQELTNAEEDQKELERENLEKENEQLALGAAEDVSIRHHKRVSADETEVDGPPGPKPVLPYSSMFILSPSNPIRRAAHWVVNLWVFDPFIMFVIALSSIALATEDPVEADSPTNKILNKIDHGFTLVFAIELFLKIIDLGVVLHPGSYCRDLWNILDAIVVVCALLAFVFDAMGSGISEKLSTIKSLRVLRVLRPLKTIKRVPKLKAVFDCVVNSLKNVFNILIVYNLFQFIFAVIAVQLFNGRFQYCTDTSRHTKSTCQGHHFKVSVDGAVTIDERRWKSQDLNYDNVLQAMLTLFAVQTSEGWPGILQNSMAATRKNVGPEPGFRIEMSIFYIVYFVVFPFFFVNIFVALIIVTFQEQGEAELDEGGIDKNQKSCIDFTIGARPMERYMPKNKGTLKFKIWVLVTSAPFEYFILVLIVLNTVLLMIKFHGMSDELISILGTVNIVFTSMFSVECLLKITAFGFKHYFKDAWYVFDFITVIGSIGDIVSTSLGQSTAKLGFLRLFRAARLIKLLRQGQTIRILLWTFVQSFKALPYVCLLIAMLFFIYAIIGMQVFGNVRLNAEKAINRHNNFQNFFDAIQLLFRCATGEAWPSIMLDCVANRACDPRAGESGNNCGSHLAYPYFVSFIFFCSFLMLNLFVAVIMDNFDYLTRDSSILGAHHLEAYIQIWAQYDPSASGWVHYSEVYEMLRNLAPPLGFGHKCPYRLAYRKLIRMNMPLNQEFKVNFTTTLFALIRENLNIKMRPAKEMNQADSELRATIKSIWPLQAEKLLNFLVPPTQETGHLKNTVGKVYAAMLIHDNFKISRFGKARRDMLKAARVSNDAGGNILGTNSPNGQIYRQNDFGWESIDEMDFSEDEARLGPSYRNIYNHPQNLNQHNQRHRYDQRAHLQTNNHNHNHGSHNELGFTDAVTGMVEMVRKETSRSGRARAKLSGYRYPHSPSRLVPNYKHSLSDSAEISPSTPDYDKHFPPGNQRYAGPARTLQYHSPQPMRNCHSLERPLRRTRYPKIQIDNGRSVQNPLPGAPLTCRILPPTPTYPSFLRLPPRDQYFSPSPRPCRPTDVSKRPNVEGQPIFPSQRNSYTGWRILPDTPPYPSLLRLPSQIATHIGLEKRQHQPVDYIQTERYPERSLPHQVVSQYSRCHEGPSTRFFYDEDEDWC